MKTDSRHFAFGENWRNYAATIDESRIELASQKMRLLLGRESLKGMSFVDIGCGSGLHSLAALQMGARTVTAFDVDPVSVQTTRDLLTTRVRSGNWNCQEASVLELPSEWKHSFDVAYSWGVLHHTGDMWTAIERASELTAPRGGFAVALYSKTPLCCLWKMEKRIYSRLPNFLQFPLLAGYSALSLMWRTACGENPIRHIKNYKTKRGMHFWHDVHDWLGGYPYESVSRDEVIRFLDHLGFSLSKEFPKRKSLGFWGAGCAEYLFQRR